MRSEVHAVLVHDVDPVVREERDFVVVRCLPVRRDHDDAFGIAALQRGEHGAT